MTADASLPPADVQRPTPPLTDEELAEMSDEWNQADEADRVKRLRAAYLQAAVEAET